MSMADDTTRTNEGEPELPLLVLPASGATLTQGLGVGFGAITAGSLAPQPVADTDTGGAGADGNLASRIEQILSEDGRFASLGQSVTVSADEDGHVLLSGALSEPYLKRSLLATIHAVPGVTQVTDETQ